MKKIFAVLSLIAILTVSFTTKASAVDTDNNVEYVASYDSPEFVAVATVDAVSVEGIAVINSVEFTIATIVEDVILPDIELSESLNKEVINVAVDSVNYLEGETISVAVNTVSLDKDNSNEYAELSTHFGILSTNFELIEPLPTINEYVTNYNYTYGYETPEFLKEISSNIGKLTTFNI